MPASPASAHYGWVFGSNMRLVAPDTLLSFAPLCLA